MTREGRADRTRKKLVDDGGCVATVCTMPTTDLCARVQTDGVHEQTRGYCLCVVMFITAFSHSFYILTTTCKGFIFDQMIQQQQQQQQQDLVKPSFISVWLRKDKLLTKCIFIFFILFCYLPYLSLRPSFPLLTCLCTRTHVNFIYHYLYVFCIKPLHSFIVSCLNCLLFI